MFDDVIKTIKAQLYDRVTSPLFGTFVMSWLGWNWRLPVLFLFDSSMHVTDKFAYISTNLYPAPSNYWFNGLLYPLVTTGFFIGVYPWLARPVYGYWRYQQKKQKELQQKIDDETTLTVEEARELRRDVLKTELKYQAESEQRESRIKELEGIIKSFQQEPIMLSSVAEKDELLRQASEEITTKTEEATKEMLAILQEMAVYTNGVDRSVFTGNLPTMERVKKDHYIDLLLAERFLDANIGQLYMNAKGRAAIVKSSLDVQ